MIKRVVTYLQKSDMGDGLGEYQFETKTSLKQFLKYFVANSHNWGLFTIIFPSGEILRMFDYDLHTKHECSFYYNLSWELNFNVKEATFRYCFMNEDVTVKLEK